MHQWAIHGQANKNGTKQSTYDDREANEKDSIGIDHEYSITCDCLGCQQQREHSWHVQGPGTSQEGWSGLLRAEGCLSQVPDSGSEDEHGDNLEGENVPVSTPPAEIRKRRKEQEDEELVREKPLLHSAAWQILPPVVFRQSMASHPSRLDN